MMNPAHAAEDAPLVTAIIIFLDEAAFLAEAVESVLAQTYPRWELLLVDDGSTDASSAVARGYAARHPGRIRYLEHPGHANRGMSASRNLGLAHARGRYVGFLDGDDVWLPDKLRDQVRILGEHREADMVYGRTLIWHSWGDGDCSRDFFYELGVRADRLVSPPTLLVRLIENRVQTPTTCNALVRLDAARRVGGFDPSFRGLFEDQVFFMKVCATSKVFVASSCWARYRQHGQSCSARAEARGGVDEARARLLGWLSGYLRERRVLSPRAWGALWRQRAALGLPALRALDARRRALWGRVRRWPSRARSRVARVPATPPGANPRGGGARR
jgi:hypothetical protein